MIEAKPLLGWGWEQFQAKAANFHRINDQNRLTRADLEEHNVFLSNAVELGLIGLTIWGLALVCAIGGAILRRGPPELTAWRIGLIAIAAQWFVVANFVPLGYAFPNALLWLWAGIASARPEEPLERIPVARTRPTPEPAPSPATA
jgi:O-antigen ligase